MNYNEKSGTTINPQGNFKGILFDLAIYISVMFLVREIYFNKVGFIVNGLFWSLTTFLVANWRMRARGVTWRELGLVRPANFKKTLLVAGLIVIVTITAIVIFGQIKEQIPFLATPKIPANNAVTKFGELKGNWPLFFSLISMIWLESFFEEILDRGFLMNWIEKLFSKTRIATFFAVIFQAVIFGFRHSNDFSERSITVAIIGLIMGIAYVLSGRNLWPLIIAHCIINSISMIERVL